MTRCTLQHVYVIFSFAHVFDEHVVPPRCIHVNILEIASSITDVCFCRLVSHGLYSL